MGDSNADLEMAGRMLTVFYPVKESAVVLRINRKLAKSREILRRARVIRDRETGETVRFDTDLGRAYTVDTFHNTVVRTHLDVGELARELGVLPAWETITED